MITDHSVLEGLGMEQLGDADPCPAERVGDGGEAGVRQLGMWA